VSALSGSRLRVVTASASDRGRRRTINEDSHAIVTRPWGTAAAECTLMVVADGMGGANAGEEASRLAVDTVVRTFFESADADVPGMLLRALKAANQEVFTKSQEDPECAGMGTTCTALAFVGGDSYFAHVGDSRLYVVLREGRMERLTRDHTLLAELIANGQLTPEEAKSDRRRNIVTRSVGVAPQISVDVGPALVPIHAGDTLLICTDGLHGQLGDEEIARSALESDLEAACRDLVWKANDRGGPDTITVAIARAVEEGRDDDVTGAPPTLQSLEQARSRTRRLLILAILALLAALAGTTWFVVRVASTAP
jgi:serine/threonine protein phosphatase PrpC